MKYLLPLLLIISIPLSAALQPKRKAIYECVDMKDNSKVERVFIYESRLGATDFYEAQIIPEKIYYPDAKDRFLKVNFTSKYRNNVQTYARGTFRIKVHRAIPTEKKFPSSAYIPEYNIQSSKWTCKDL